MSRVPVFCIACARFFLLPRHLVGAHAAPLCSCGSAARVLSCAPCPRDDQWLFEAVADTIEIAQITPLAAARLLAALDATNDGAAEKLACLKKLAPELGVIEGATGSTERTLRRALSIIEALLDALSQIHAGSGMFLSVATKPRSGAGRS